MELAEQLVEHLLAPLAGGGDVRPLRPIGARAAARLAATAPPIVGEPGVAFLVQRGRRLRGLFPADPPATLAAGEWHLACALNDWLQLANESLDGWLAKSRRRELLQLVEQNVVCAGPPPSLQAALLRFASFAGVAGLTRTDTELRWWTGQARFVGRRPPGRMLTWPELRRVHVHEEQVALFDLDQRIAGQLSGSRFVLGRWLAANPLLDLALAQRSAPAFRWTGALLGLLRHPIGRSLALRAALHGGLLSAGVEQAQARCRALASASQQLPRQLPDTARQLLDAFLADLEAAVVHESNAEPTPPRR